MVSIFSTVLWVHCFSRRGCLTWVLHAFQQFNPICINFNRNAPKVSCMWPVFIFPFCCYHRIIFLLPPLTILYWTFQWEFGSREIKTCSYHYITQKFSQISSSVYGLLTLCFTYYLFISLFLLWVGTGFQETIMYIKNTRVSMQHELFYNRLSR